MNVDPKNPSAPSLPFRLPGGRVSHRFPTRQFPYRKGSTANLAAQGQPPEFALPEGRICRFIFGRDEAPGLMTPDEIAAQLNDPFATLLLRRGVLPMTTRILLSELDQFDGRPDGLPLKKNFLVADGGQIRWSHETNRLNRLLRIVIVRGRDGQAELLISASTVFDSTSQFLQVFSWDPQKAAFNFYERRSGAWCWAGSSWDALEPDTRGNGPFDSHVNGGPVMKELKIPWMHWHSQSAKITDEVLAPDDPLRNEPLYRLKSGGEDLEKFIRSCIGRWTRARFDRCITTGHLTHAREFMRQVVTTTTVNLTTSAHESRVLQEGDSMRLPRTFFLNSDALLALLQLPLTFLSPKTDAKHYLKCLERYDVKIRDEEFEFAGDTHFAFVVPEPAYEDLIILDELLSRKIISRKCAASLLLVDFPNAIFSERRAQLGQYVPQDIPLQAEGAFEAIFIPAVRAAGGILREGTPEWEFLTWWELPDESWEREAVTRLEQYLNLVTQQLNTSDGFDGFFRLAESRRREFRRRPLAEFRLTTPATNIPEDAPLLMMTANATVQTKP